MGSWRRGGEVESQSEDAFPFHIRSTNSNSIRKTCQVGGEEKFDA